MTDIDKVMAEINKKYPDTPILTGKELLSLKLEKESTGSVWLDYALAGGFPRGRMVELYGPPSSGKSLIALKTIAKAQAKGLSCIYIDAEQAFDSQHSIKLGVDINKLRVVRESGGERVFNIVLKLLETKPDIIVIDSVASLVPESEEEEPVEKQTMALQARMMSKAMRKLTGPVSRANTLMIFINQTREKVGAYGDPSITSGGKALGFYASVRVEIRKGAFIELKDTEDLPDGASKDEKARKVGQVIHFKVTKSKVSIPWKSGSFEYYYNGVINEADEIVSLLEYNRAIERRGAYYYLDDNTSFQGRSAFTKAIREQPEIKKRVNKLLQTIL